MITRTADGQSPGRDAERIGLSGLPADRTFAELLIDCEEDRTLRAVAVLVSMLRERQLGT